MSTYRRLAAAVGAAALAWAMVPNAAQADVVFGDGDDTYAYPTNGPQSIMDFGQVCAGGSYDLTAGIVVRRSGTNTSRIWLNSEVLDFSVVSASTGLSATTPASAALPSDWQTRSQTIPASDLEISSSTVTLTPTGPVGAKSGTIVFDATGTSVAGTEWTDDDLMEVSWTVVQCPDIDLTKSVDADYVMVGDSIPYVYQVENTGTEDLENVSIVDDTCSPVEYASGNTGNPNLFSVGETWTFTCEQEAPLAQASTLLTNSAEATAYTLPGIPVTDEDSYTLQSFALRKLVAIYWDYIDFIADPDAADVEFTVDVYKDSVKVGEEPLSVNSPMLMWLTPGDWGFEEQTPPTGYRVFDDRGAWDVGEVPSSDYLDNTFINGSDFDLAIAKSGPKLAKVGEDIDYGYTVTNAGPAAVTPIVTDDSCTPVEYAGGDTNVDGLIQPTETWTYTCTTSTSQSDWAAEFPAGDLTNTATVADAEADDLEAPYGLFGGDVNTANNSDAYTLYPFVLRKDVRLYNNGGDSAFSDPSTEFGVKFSTTGFNRSMTVSESEPLYVWLADGTWTIQETSYPKGYFPKEGYYTTGITHVTGQFPDEYYPDWTIVNITWSGCSHGYWKNHPADWPATYDPTDLVGEYFPQGLYDGSTLAQALAFNGGGGTMGAQRILLIQAVAALLNEAEHGTAFGPYASVAALKTAVNSALASGNRTTMLDLATTLDYWNNGICR